MKDTKANRLKCAAAVGAMGGIAYLAANAWASLAGAKDIQFGFEKNIPFVPEAVFIYLLIFPFFLAPVFLIEKYRDFLLVAGVYFNLVTVSVIIFFVFPTTMERPAATVSGLAGKILNAVWVIDGKNNLFPSLHVSSVVFIALANGYFCRKSRLMSAVLALIISLSTLLVKQHTILDVLGGAVFGFGAFWLLRIFKEKEARD